MTRPEYYPENQDYTPNPPRPPTNPYAVVSLVLGILCNFIAIPFGHVARHQIRERGEGGSGIALAGLILGYLSLAAIVLGLVLAAAVFNAFSTAVSNTDTSQSLPSTGELYPYPGGGDSGDETGPSQSPTHTDNGAGAADVPSDATVCPQTQPESGGFTHSAVGNSITSCPFAEAVRDAYNRAISANSPTDAAVTVTATSPVTGKSYPMSCVRVGVVTCTGGEDALLYLY